MCGTYVLSSRPETKLWFKWNRHRHLTTFFLNFHIVDSSLSSFVQVIPSLRVALYNLLKASSHLYV